MYDYIYTRMVSVQFATFNNQKACDDLQHLRTQQLGPRNQIISRRSSWYIKAATVGMENYGKSTMEKGGPPG